MRSPSSTLTWWSPASTTMKRFIGGGHLALAGVGQAAGRVGLEGGADVGLAPAGAGLTGE
jgi:hypothetical protein